MLCYIMLYYSIVIYYFHTSTKHLGPLETQELGTESQAKMHSTAPRRFTNRCSRR